MTLASRERPSFLLSPFWLRRPRVWTLLAQVPLALGLRTRRARPPYGIVVWHLHGCGTPGDGLRHERAVLVFDLDDTLYPERQFARSGFERRGAGRRRSSASKVWPPT